MGFKNEQKILNQIKHKLKEGLEKGAAPLVVLDADGTLWPEDINHILLHYQQVNHLLEVADLLSSYKSDTERVNRCMKFAERQSAFSVEEFKKQCREVLDKTPVNVFSFQKNLISFLKEKEMKVVVVTASLEFLVEEALKRNNLPVDKVLGVKTKIKQGRWTSEVIKPVTYQEGKREALLNYTKKTKPLLAGGNSKGDQAFLEIAQIAFVVNSADKEHENFSSEQKMKIWAKENNQFLFEM